MKRNTNPIAKPVGDACEEDVALPGAVPCRQKRAMVRLGHSKNCGRVRRHGHWRQGSIKTSSHSVVLGEAMPEFGDDLCVPARFHAKEHILRLLAALNRSVCGKGLTSEYER